MAEENKNLNKKNIKVSDQGIKTKKITAEEIMAKARHMQEISDDQDIIRRIEETAARFSEVDVNELLKGIQEIVDSDNAQAADDKGSGDSKGGKDSPDSKEDKESGKDKPDGSSTD